MRKRLLLFAVAFMLSAPVRAQSSDPLGWAADQLSASLSGLQESIDKLATGNMALAEKIEQKKMDIEEAQAGLQKLANDQNHLQKSALKLQEDKPSRAKKIEQLEHESFDIDTSLKKATEEIGAQQELLTKREAESKGLEARLKEMDREQLRWEQERQQPEQADIPVPELPKDPYESLRAAAAQHEAQQEKEKLQLLKMIEASKQKQADLYRQIEERSMLAPVVTVETASDQAVLERQVKETRDEVEQLREIMDRPAAGLVHWSPEQMRELEAKVRGLQRNHEELEELVSNMQKKARKVAQIPVSQRVEQNRLLMNLEDLNKEAKKLRTDLSFLRRQMVTLDKRKTYLEGILRK